jgi:hypothetical protein
LEQWEQELSNLLLVSSVAENEAIKKLIAQLTLEVDLIDQRLLTENSRTLPEYGRDLLFEKKFLYLRVIGYFDTSRLKDLEKEIDANLHI